MDSMIATSEAGVDPPDRWGHFWGEFEAQRQAMVTSARKRAADIGCSQVVHHHKYGESCNPGCIIIQPPRIK